MISLEIPNTFILWHPSAGIRGDGTTFRHLLCHYWLNFKSNMMFIISTTLDSQLNHNPKTKCDFCPRNAQTSQLLSRNCNRSKLRCVICHSCICKKDTHFYCEICVCDIRLGAVVPVKIPVVNKPRKCTLKSETLELNYTV